MWQLLVMVLAQMRILIHFDSKSVTEEEQQQRLEKLAPPGLLLARLTMQTTVKAVSSAS